MRRQLFYNIDIILQNGKIKYGAIVCKKVTARVDEAKLISEWRNHKSIVTSDPSIRCYKEIPELLMLRSVDMLQQPHYLQVCSSNRSIKLLPKISVREKTEYSRKAKAILTATRCWFSCTDQNKTSVIVHCPCPDNYTWLDRQKAQQWGQHTYVPFEDWGL